MMRFCTTLPIIVLLGFAPISFAADNPVCLEEYKSEIARIGLDAERKARANPPGRDLKAQQQFMIPVNAAMQAAVERVRQCEEKARGAAPAPSATANLRAKQCIDQADRQITELRQRNAGRNNLSRGEQMALRDEENRIDESRSDCLRQAR